MSCYSPCLRILSVQEKAIDTEKSVPSMPTEWQSHRQSRPFKFHTMKLGGIRLVSPHMLDIDTDRRKTTCHVTISTTVEQNHYSGCLATLIWAGEAESNYICWVPYLWWTTNKVIMIFDVDSWWLCWWYLPSFFYYLTLLAPIHPPGRTALRRIERNEIIRIRFLIAANHFVPITFYCCVYRQIYCCICWEMKKVFVSSIYNSNEMCGGTLTCEWSHPNNQISLRATEQPEWVIHREVSNALKLLL